MTIIIINENHNPRSHGYLFCVGIFVCVIVILFLALSPEFLVLVNLLQLNFTT